MGIAVHRLGLMTAIGLPIERGEIARLDPIQAVAGRKGARASVSRAGALVAN